MLREGACRRSGATLGQDLFRMRVTFDRFVLDTGTRELYREGRALDLTPKAFELLVILFANRPRVVTKTELQEQLWPDRFVVDKNLANLVSEVRDALGDDPSNPRFIRTAHRIGYAFSHQEGKKTLGQPLAAPGNPIVRLSWDSQRLTLPDGEHTVGRDPDADVYIDSPRVSRRHALIRVSGAEVTVEDLGSTNGTFVGDRQIDTLAKVEHGDAVRVGSTVLTIRVLVAPGSTVSE